MYTEGNRKRAKHSKSCGVTLGEKNVHSLKLLHIISKLVISKASNRKPLLTDRQIHVSTSLGL